MTFSHAEEKVLAAFKRAGDRGLTKAEISRESGIALANPSLDYAIRELLWGGRIVRGHDRRLRIVRRRKN